MANRLLTILAALAITIGLPRAASAEKRIVVLQFDGPDAKKFRQVVGKIVAKRSQIISSRKYAKAARKLRAKSQSKRNVRRVAKEIGVDGVVDGKVKRKGNKYKIWVRVRSGQSGEQVGDTVTFIVEGTDVPGKTRRKVANELEGILDELTESRTRDDERDEEDEEERRDLDRDDDDDDRDRDDEDKDEDKDEDEEEKLDLSDEELADLKARSRAIIVSAGAGAVIRDLSFNAADTGMQPPGYNSGAVPVGNLRAEAYPLAFNLANKGVKRDIGLSLEFEKILQINTTIDDGQGTVLDLPTEQQRYALGVVFRKNFGNTPMSPTIKLSVRYNRARFNIDKTAAIDAMLDVDVPNVDYKYYDPGLGVRYPLNEKAALNVEARFLSISAAGEVQQSDEYGGASITGFDADAHIAYQVNERLFIVGGVRAMGFAFDFNPADPNNLAARVDRNGDGVQDVGGALDRYVGGYAQAGYVF